MMGVDSDANTPSGDLQGKRGIVGGGKPERMVGQGDDMARSQDAVAPLGVREHAGQKCRSDAPGNIVEKNDLRSAA